MRSHVPVLLEESLFDYHGFFSAEIDGLKARGGYRTFLDVQREAGSFPSAVHHDTDADSRINVWCSNDYLGMGQHPLVLEAMHRAIDETGAGSGGSRNISGNNHYHVLLEQELAALHGTEAALIFPSGYAANDAALTRALRARQPAAPMGPMAPAAPSSSSPDRAASTDRRCAGPTTRTPKSAPYSTRSTPSPRSSPRVASPICCSATNPPAPHAWPPTSPG